MGNNTGITVAGAWGQFELNVFKPMLIAALLQSVRCLCSHESSSLLVYVGRIHRICSLPEGVDLPPAQLSCLMALQAARGCVNLIHRQLCGESDTCRQGARHMCACMSNPPIVARRKCMSLLQVGIEANRPRIEELLHNSLMLVTALNNKV